MSAGNTGQSGRFFVKGFLCIFIGRGVIGKEITLRIEKCKVNHLTDPVGYELSNLRISWTVEDSLGKRQTAARILISDRKKMDHLIYDTGWEQMDSLGQEIPLKTKPRTRYYYTVSVRSDAEEEATSKICFFETSKEKEKWNAEWITCREKGNSSPVFCRKIQLADRVSSARLYITGLGLYEAFYNGKRVGDEYLTPYCNDYTSWIQYQTYDITDLLSEDGELSVMLGNGWYKGRFTYESKHTDKGRYGDRFLLLAELRITYQNGQTEVIGTDGNWTVKKSNITFSNIYDGEYRDDSFLSQGNAAQKAIRVKKEDIPKARLTARLSQPVKVIRPLKAELLHTPKGELVLDVGQNITGSFRMKVKLKKGNQLKLSFGELLQDGEFYRENLRSAKAEYLYTSDGKENILQPHFTFYGYRYVKVEGYDDIKPEDFSALPYSTELEETGRISTGDRRVNKLISNIRWSCRDNFVDVPTDCPQRDERMGWTGDAQAFSASATYLTDSYAFYRKYLYDLAKEQKKVKGNVPFTIPSFGMCKEKGGWAGGGSAVWGDAATIIPWVLYRYYGDLTILREQYASMKGWVDHITSRDGKDCGWRREFHFGDWLALDVPGADVSATSGATDVAFIADVYYMASAKIVSDTADLIGLPEEAKAYRDLSDRIRSRIGEEFYSPNGRCCCDTQTGLLLTLKHHLADPERNRKRLREKLERNGNKLDCGFVGAPILCMTLSENAMSDMAVKLLLNTEFPGWLHEVELGATTVWERWNSLDENGHISSTGMNSLNHYAYGSVLEWMFAYLAGIRPNEAGFRSAILEPVPVPQMKYAKASYRSAVGLWECGWKILEGPKIEVTCRVPFGATADLILPYAKRNSIRHLDAGEYSFVYKADRGLEKV